MLTTTALAEDRCDSPSANPDSKSMLLLKKLASNTKFNLWIVCFIIGVLIFSASMFYEISKYETRAPLISTRQVLIVSSPDGEGYPPPKLETWTKRVIKLFS